MRLPLSQRVQVFLASHPHFANRLLQMRGIKRIEGASQRSALRAAQRAYKHVPFYRSHFERAGFTADKMQRMTWKDFLLLPQVSKDDTEGVGDKDLIDSQTPSPGEDSMIGRSSGTTRAPVHWPVGWLEFYLTRAAFEVMLRSLDAHTGVPTAVVVTNTVEGGDQSGNMPYRAFFSLKEEKRWNMEIIATGEDSATTHTWLRWLAQQGYHSLLLISFPGTVERLLAYINSLPENERVNWDAFRKKHFLSGGQLLVQSFRQKIRREMRLDPASLASETILYISSDTGQLMARTTPFTLWLERYMDEHPALYDAIGLPLEHRDKPLLEFIPPLSIHFELDRPEGLILTMWKHRPLIRYKIGDLVWGRRVNALADLLNKHAPNWKQDFQRAGGHPQDISMTAMLAVVLGRADEIAIVNAANISPSIVRQALEASEIAPSLNHFKHRADPAHPNEYSLYLELKDTREEAAREALAKQWHDALLNALLEVPAATDLAAAHHANPICFNLFVRSYGEDEFLGDAEKPKKTHAVPLRKSEKI